MISVQRQDTWGVVGLDPRGQYEYTGTRSDPARKTPGRAQTAMPSGQGEQMASVAASHHGVVAAARCVIDCDSIHGFLRLLSLTWFKYRHFGP